MNNTTASNLLSLDERRCANEIALAIGRWGISWLFDVCIEIFEEIAKDERHSCCERVNAETRILLFQSFKNLFEGPPIETSEPTKIS